MEPVSDPNPKVQEAYVTHDLYDAGRVLISLLGCIVCGLRPFLIESKIKIKFFEMVCIDPKSLWAPMRIIWAVCSTVSTTPPSPRLLGHQSNPDHFERVLHCDVSGRASWVGHGHRLWRELDGDDKSDSIF